MYCFDLSYLKLIGAEHIYGYIIHYTHTNTCIPKFKSSGLRKYLS